MADFDADRVFLEALDDLSHMNRAQRRAAGFRGSLDKATDRRFFPMAIKQAGDRWHVLDAGGFVRVTASSESEAQIARQAFVDRLGPLLERADGR